MARGAWAALSASATMTVGGACVGHLGDVGDVDVGPADAAVLPDRDSWLCASGLSWNGSAGANMRPGSACGACHGTGAPVAGAPVAGTVYGALHDSENCWGGDLAASARDDASISVVLDGASGVSVVVPVQRSGNFFLHAPELGATFFVTIARGAASRRMTAAVSNGDCNGCHSARGEQGAPGRILVP